jgi:hypothetical protein
VFERRQTTSNASGSTGKRCGRRARHLADTAPGAASSTPNADGHEATTEMPITATVRLGRDVVIHAPTNEPVRLQIGDATIGAFVEIRRTRRSVRYTRFPLTRSYAGVVIEDEVFVGPGVMFINDHIRETAARTASRGG